MNRNVKFLDLHKQYLSIKKEIDNVIEQAIKHSTYIGGKNVEDFEYNFAKSLNVRHCVSCANGTDALFISLKALGVKKGDEVIVPAHSWISTSETISLCEAKVIFCDTHNDNFTINENLIKDKINKNTVGIIPVHLYGHAANMDKIIEIAKDNGLWIIEDTAQAHLGKYNEKFLGSIGDIGTFSFYPGKNLGAYGDAGAIVTNCDKLANFAKKFSTHGGKGDHIMEGINSRLDSIQAGILNVKLKYLQDWTASRQKIANKYIKHLSKIDTIKVPTFSKNVDHVWHQFVIKSQNRNKLMEKLSKFNIGTVIHYPIALPFLKAYAHQKNKPTDFPNAFKNQNEILSLPIYPELSNEELIYIINKIKLSVDEIIFEGD